MAGTKEGAAKRRATMIEKLGGEEAYELFMKKNSSKGGINGGRGGFAADPVLAREAGARGGRSPRKGKRNVRSTN